MEHNHSHSHAAPPLANLNTAGLRSAFVIGIVLNAGYVLVQIGVGLRINSLSLLSDAGHNFLDVAGLALSLLAYKLHQIRPTDRYTYGYRKVSILVSLVNAVLLLVSIGAIGYEAFSRFAHPEPLPGGTIAIIAGIGIVINAVSALFFWRDKDHDLNVKSAFLHLASDALVSVGLVLGGVLIHYTGLYWIDPLLSLVICVVIIASTWSLLRDSLRLSLDGVPDGIDLEEVKKTIRTTAGVAAVHHVHIWAMSTSQNALTAHIVVGDTATLSEIDKLKSHIKHELMHLNIQHSTLEVETKQTPEPDCDTGDC